MEGETLVIGPLPVTGGLEVTQRLGLTADRRALRTILTFRNTSFEAVDVQASYFHDLGITVSDTSEVAVDSGEGPGR